MKELLLSLAAGSLIVISAIAWLAVWANSVRRKEKRRRLEHFDRMVARMEADEWW